MLPLLNQIVLSQFEGSLAMLNDCIAKCPEAHWDTPIAKYPFWQVAYHTLYCTDGYLSPTEESWRPHPTFHPGGLADVEEEYPSRRFTKEEVTAYLAFVLQKARQTMAAETAETLAGPSGVKRHTFSRAELHFMNIRHLQHHTGQLGVSLRKVGVDPMWVKAGWR